jgi:hypothetical protein
MTADFESERVNLAGDAEFQLGAILRSDRKRRAVGIGPKVALGM